MKKKLVNLAFTLAIVFLAINGNCAPSPSVKATSFIKVDQFGYKTLAQKVAVISDPQIGYNSALAYTPGNRYQIRNWTTNAVAFTGTPIKWKSGATHSQSGDKVWWFDFSALTKAGSYYVYDAARYKRSGRFEISNVVYRNVMKAAMRMFYYQRSGFAKVAPYVDTGYADGASHLGPLQDLDCRLVNNGAANTSKNLSGGWFDAGDYNKYVNFVWSPILDLLLAYEQKPSVWTDNYNIPESGNGVPDILDEVKYELDWLLKMQNSDGSILSLVGTEHYATASPPSADTAQRWYGPATTQATYSGAGMFALASIQFDALGQTEYATILRNAAIKAWDWANTYPDIIFHNNDNVTNFLAAGDQESDDPAWSTARRKFAAAVYLYAATRNKVYRTFIDDDYTHHINKTVGASSGNLPEIDALLYYTKTTDATVEVKDTVLSIITNSLRNGPNNLPSVNRAIDAYRAYISEYNGATNSFVSIYNWGSNEIKSHQAITFLNMNQYGLDTTNARKYYNAASGFVHYFHGVNPNSKTYLTNMSRYGAENSVKSIYHAWFANKSSLWDYVGVSSYGPAPGYVPGGPNQNYTKDAACSFLIPDPGCAETTTPPQNQPAQKSWKDFNTSWPINSWTVTEPQIFNQAAYVRMLSKFL